MRLYVCSAKSDAHTEVLCVCEKEISGDRVYTSSSLWLLQHDKDRLYGRKEERKTKIVDSGRYNGKVKGEVRHTMGMLWLQTIRFLKQKTNAPFL